jgi:hypothetical protein
MDIGATVDMVIAILLAVIFFAGIVIIILAVAGART